MRFRHVLLTMFNRRPGGSGTFSRKARLDEGWLRDRWRLFSAYTVPSVAAQNNSDFTWIILCHPESPEWFRALAETVDMAPEVHFSFLLRDPVVDHLADAGDTLLVTGVGPSTSLHREAAGRIRGDCEADPYTSEAVTLTDGYLLDEAARRMRPYHAFVTPLRTRIILEPDLNSFDMTGCHGTSRDVSPERSITDGEPMFVLAGHVRQGPDSADGCWLAASATAEILNRDFGIALARDGGGSDSAQAHSFPRPRAKPASKPAWLLGQPAASPRQRVVVSIPCSHAWDSLGHAVESALDQDYPDLLVVAANDGDDHPRWDVLSHLDDPRLVRIDYPASRGRYFADQIVLMARLGKYVLFQDADEWNEPDRVRSLLEAMRRDHGIAAVSPYYRHETQTPGSSTIVSPILPTSAAMPLCQDGLGRQPGAAYQGLFDASSLLSVGGCYGGYRLEYGRFLMNLICLSGQVVCLRRPLYHRNDRSGSFAGATLGRFDPAAHWSAAADLERLYQEAYHVYCEYLQGTVGFPALGQQLRALAWRHVAASEWEVLNSEACRLRWQVKATATANSQADLTSRPSGAARRRRHEQQAAREGSGDGLLAAYTLPAYSLPGSSRAVDRARHAPFAVAGVLTARSRATLVPDAIVHGLLPHDALVMLERTGADLVLIEAAAMLPGSAWSYAADPAAADRGRRLADLVELAHALGRPVVFLRNLPRYRIPGLDWLDAMCDAVAVGDLGVQLARFNPVGRSAERPLEPLLIAARDSREGPRQRRLIDQLTGGDHPVVRIADVPWQELPEWYRRHGLFLAASASQAWEQLACGARVVGPTGWGEGTTAPAAGGFEGMITELAAARAAGVPLMTDVRKALREIFESHATPVRLAAIARLVGLPTGIPASRQVAVLAETPDSVAAYRVVQQLLRQRLRPAEVVAFGSAETAALPARPPKPDDHHAGQVIGPALDVLRDAGIAVRVVPGGGKREAARLARYPFVAPWDWRQEHSAWYLLDLVCARECSDADVVDITDGEDYAFADGLEPALVRQDLLGDDQAPRSWERRGIRTLALACPEEAHHVMPEAP